jgi:hypothetical protein
MENRHIIKLTRQQLTEAEDGSFNYLGNGDFKQYNSQSEISVTGKKDDEEWGKPKTSDDFADKISSQGYNRFSGYAYQPHTLREEDGDTDNDGVDDYYNNEELDTLGNNNRNDDLVKIPQGVQQKLNVLIGAMSSLTPKQQAIVMNKFIESFDLSTLPYSWLKELRLKINTKRKEVR